MPPDPAFEDPYFSEPHIADLQYQDWYHTENTGPQADPESTSDNT